MYAHIRAIYMDIKNSVTCWSKCNINIHNLQVFIKYGREKKRNKLNQMSFVWYKYEFVRFFV